MASRSRWPAAAHCCARRACASITARSPACPCPTAAGCRTLGAAAWCSTPTAVPCRRTVATLCWRRSSGGPEARQPSRLPACHTCRAPALPPACLPSAPSRAHRAPPPAPAPPRAYWSPAATTGQRYIYTGSADGRVHVYGGWGALWWWCDLKEGRGVCGSVLHTATAYSLPQPSLPETHPAPCAPSPSHARRRHHRAAGGQAGWLPPRVCARLQLAPPPPPPRHWCAACSRCCLHVRRVVGGTRTLLAQPCRALAHLPCPGACRVVTSGLPSTALPPRPRPISWL